MFLLYFEYILLNYQSNYTNSVLNLAMKQLLQVDSQKLLLNTYQYFIYQHQTFVQSQKNINHFVKSFRKSKNNLGINKNISVNAIMAAYSFSRHTLSVYGHFDDNLVIPKCL